MRVYLINSLEEAHEITGLPLFTQWLSDEVSSAAEVKQNVPIMVVLGNPPYSGHSANTLPTQVSHGTFGRAADALRFHVTMVGADRDLKPVVQQEVEELSHVTLGGPLVHLVMHACRPELHAVHDAIDLVHHQAKDSDAGLVAHHGRQGRLVVQAGIPALNPGEKYGIQLLAKLPKPGR